MKAHILLLLVSTPSLLAQAQATLNGTIQDGKPLPFASVTLLNARPGLAWIGPQYDRNVGPRNVGGEALRPACQTHRQRPAGKVRLRERPGWLLRGAGHL